MSWKQYGGINKLDKMNNINVNTLSTDSFRLHGPYQGDFDISGRLGVGSTTIFGNLQVKQDSVVQNLHVKRDLVIDGNAFSNSNLVITDGSFNGSINVNNDVNLGGNIKARTNAFIFDTLFFDPNGSEFFHGENNKLGLNVYHPNATLDICGNISTVLNLYSNQENTRNVLVQNKNNRGIVLNSNTNASSIDFYVDSSLNSGNRYTSRIIQNSNGVLTLDVSYNTTVLSNMSISNRTENAHIYNETLIVYDNSYGPLHPTIYKVPSAISGNAASFIANDNSSNTFLKVITPNNTGLHINGGAYPIDQTRSMGSLNWIDNSNTLIPAQMIVSGNNAAKYRSTIGFNTYAPRTEKYVIDINGPIHITNGQIKNTATTIFEIKKISVLKNYQNNIIAIGSPSTIDISYNQNIYYSKDGGQSWKLSAVTNSADGVTNYNEGLESNSPKTFYSIYTYDNSFSVMVGDGGFIYYTSNGGIRWSELAIANQNNNYRAIFVDVSHIYFSYDVSLCYFNNPYTNIPPPTTGNTTTGNTTPISNPSSALSITTDKGYTIVYINQQIQIKSMHGVSNKLFICGNGIARYDKTNTLAANPLSLFFDLSHNVNRPSISYNCIHAYDVSNVIAVGGNIISYTKDGGTTWTDITPSNTILNSVYVFDTYNAIAVGNSGKILYTNDSYSNWNELPNEILISSGNSSVLTDPSNNFTSITMSDPNTFAISATIQNYAATSQLQVGTLGIGRLLYLFAPNLFNLANSTVLDVCGNMHLSGDILLDNSAFINNSLTVKGNIESTNPTNGTVIIRGGLGISSNVCIGGNAQITNVLYNSHIESSNPITGNIDIGTGERTTCANINIGDVYDNNNNNNNIRIGGLNDTVSVRGNIQLGANLTLNGMTTMYGNLNLVTEVGKINRIYSSSSTIQDSTSVNSGILVITGGVGISGNVFVGGNIDVNTNLIVRGNNESTSSGTGSLVVIGGIGISGNAFVGGNIDVNKNIIVRGNIDSTNTGSGSLVVTGGVGISGNAFVGGNMDLSKNLMVQGNIDSTSSGTGSLVVAGGVGISGNTFIGGNIDLTKNLIVRGNIDSTTSGNGSLVVIGGLGISGNAFIGGNITSLSTIDSTNITTGALIVSGGVGIAKNIFLGGNIDISNCIIINGEQDSTSTSTGTVLIKNGGVSITKGNLFIGGNINIASNVSSQSPLTGALVVRGGVGISENLNIGGNVNVNNKVTISQNIDSQSTATGSLVVTGGVGISGNTFVGGNLAVQSTTNSTSTNSGSLVVSGGIGIAKNMFIGGNTDISNNLIVWGRQSAVNFTDSTTTTSGAFVVYGGVGIAGNIFTGGNIIVQNQTDTTTTGNGSVIVSGGVSIAKNLVIGGNIILTKTTDSTSTTTGALVVPGGVGIAQNLFVGGNVSISKNIESTSNTTGTLIVTGGVGISGNTYVGGNINVSKILTVLDTTDSTSSGTGALVVSGGVGIAKKLFVDGITTITNTTDSTSTATGALLVSGGVGIANNVYIGGITNITNSTDSGNTTTGSLIVSGGVGIAKNLYIGGNGNIAGTMNITNSTDSVNATTGSLIVSGGVGIAKTLTVAGNINIAGNVSITNTTDSTSIESGALILSGGVGITKNVTIGGNTKLQGNLQLISSNISSVFVQNTSSNAPTSIVMQSNYSDSYASFFNGTNAWEVGLKSSDDNKLYFSYNTGLSGLTSDGRKVSIDRFGTIYCTGTTSPSDYRIKQNIIPLNNSFSVDNLKPVSYTNTLSDKQDIGFIAHEIQEEFPYLVTGKKDGEQYQSVNYTGLIGVLVHEIQLLKKEVVGLKTRIENIETQNHI